MNEPIVALPGFTIPDSPNEAERLLARPDGTIVWDVLEVDDKDKLPLLELWLLSDYSGEQIKRLLLDPKQISLLNVEDSLGRRQIRATIMAKDLSPTTDVADTDGIKIEPGTYRLQALLAGVKVAERWLTIEATAQNAAWLGVNKFHDCPIVLKPDTTP